MPARRGFRGIRFLLFDIDDTLFPSSEFAKKARKNAIAAMLLAGLPAGANSVSAALREIICKKGANNQEHFDLLCKKLKCKNPAKIIACAIRAYHDTKRQIAPYPGAKSLLAKLHKRGFVLCAATEGLAKKQWDKLIRLGLQDSFEHVFISEELGLSKSPKFYARICRLLGAKPAMCAMIGNHPVLDVLSSHKAGMVAIRVLKGKHQKEKCNSDFAVRSISEVGRLPILK